ncbi:hypothetical protein [Aminiphilus circumscriptus]|uniref:hypothetical protein n=1 Tax=Aminiphilus circumscriptus TaxID=290732 RepID=UPI001B7FB859|nr:hypothetical protein [Aminiphilus circumscriptus]
MNQAKCPPPGETAKTTLSENEAGQHMSEAQNNGVFRLLGRLVEESAVSFALHEHCATRTVADAMDALRFDVSRLAKKDRGVPRSGRRCCPRGTSVPTVYCGIGRPDRTLEIAPADLLTLSGARSERFSR